MKKNENRQKKSNSKYKKSRVYKEREYNSRASGPEGKGTNRSIGSNKRLKDLAQRKSCLNSNGKSCWR